MLLRLPSDPTRLSNNIPTPPKIFGCTDRLGVKVWEGICDGSACNYIFPDLSSDDGEGGECSVECMARRACARVGVGGGDTMV